MRFLIITECSKNDWTFNEWMHNGLDANIIFKYVPKFLRAIRRIWITCGFPIPQIWYSREWKQKVINTDVVVIHNISELLLSLPLYINKLNPKAKVIAWYWNSVRFSILPSQIKGRCEKWSFDPEDCKKYGLKFNHQYYFKSLITSNDEPPVNDVFFCGRDATRGEMLINLYNKLKSNGLNVLFKIFRPQYSGIPDELKTSYIPYSEMINKVSKSRALVEILKDGQSGATLRLMEALFNKKKVITTNKAVKEEPFYNPQNIFIIGERPDSELYDFVKSDYVNSNESFIEQYDVHKWLEHFVE